MGLTEESEAWRRAEHGAYATLQCVAQPDTHLVRHSLAWETITQECWGPNGTYTVNRYICGC